MTGETQDNFFESLKTRLSISDPHATTVSQIKASPSAKRMLHTEVQKAFSNMDNTLSISKELHKAEVKILKDRIGTFALRV